MLTRRLDETYDMTFGHGLNNFAKDAEATGQRVKQRLLLLLSEWFLDQSAGVPYLQEIMVKPADIPLAESLIKKAILGTEGVLEITSFSLDFDTVTRKATVSATVKTTYEDNSNIKVNLL